LAEDNAAARTSWKRTTPGTTLEIWLRRIWGTELDHRQRFVKIPAARGSDSIMVWVFGSDGRNRVARLLAQYAGYQNLGRRIRLEGYSPRLTIRRFLEEGCNTVVLPTFIMQHDFGETNNARGPYLVQEEGAYLVAPDALWGDFPDDAELSRVAARVGSKAQSLSLDPEYRILHWRRNITFWVESVRRITGEDPSIGLNFDDFCSHPHGAKDVPSHIGLLNAIWLTRSGQT
jgi:hypothetical protein